MNQGILMSADIDFMIHGIFQVEVFGQKVWITTSHACILIVMAIMLEAEACNGQTRCFPERH